jgi:gamma-glutamyltranspeptidase/glutathione hydrolase
MAGIEAMHSRFGRLPFADLFQPAIWYAENGVTISPGLAAYFQMRQTTLQRTVEGRRFASMPDGSPPKSGDLYRQPDLARTLRAVASEGASYMYTGDWARAFVAAVDAEGGKANLADLQRYKAEWREPLSVNFAGATVYAPGGPSDGSCSQLEALNLLAGLKVEGMGPYWRDPKAFASYVHALRFAEYGHEARVLTDLERTRGFSPDCRSRLSPAYAKSFAPDIAPEAAPPSAVPAASAPAGSHTESVVVVDRWGNVAVLVHSINCILWGDTGIVVGGIPIADAGAINKRTLAAIKPGDRVPETISPVIALRKNKPVLAVATVGASLVPETTRIVGGVLASGSDLRTVMNAPALLLNFSPTAGSLWNWPESVPRGAYDLVMQRATQALGLPLREETPAAEQRVRGTAAAIAIDQPSGVPSAVVVPQLDVFAEADRPITVERPKEIRLSAAILDRYVGDYQVGARFFIHVERNGDHLYSTPTGRPRLELFAMGEDAFFEKVEDVQVRFKRDASSHATGALIHRANAPDAVAVRKAPAP